MSKTFTKTYNKYKIQEFSISKDAIVFSDSHCNLANIKKLQELYPTIPLYSLGDLTFLHKAGIHNNLSIDYFIKYKIPALLGNHDSFILDSEIGNSFGFSKVIGNAHFQDFDLTQQQIDFLKRLPIGFKFILPDNTYYLAFHNLPTDLWSTYDNLNANQFQDAYPIDENCRGVISGHTHRNIFNEYIGIRAKRYVVGQLCNDNRHSDNNGGGNYLLLTENGIEFKKL